MMSINNLVSYLVGWGELVLKWQHKKSNGLPCDFPETGYKWNELGKLAQKFYKDYEQLQYGDQLLKLDVVVDDILRVVENIDNGTLYGTPWYGRWTLGRMIQLNTSSPFKNARIRLRKYLRKRKSGQD
ncbi:ClbS/DfsB family four-helix bundle protein [Pedobacter panaciterrae]